MDVPSWGIIIYHQPIDRNNGVTRSIESDYSSKPRHQLKQLELERLSESHRPETLPQTVPRETI